MQKKIEEFYMVKVENSNNKNHKGLIIFLIILVIVIALSTCFGIRCAIKANEGNDIANENINESNQGKEATEEIKVKIPIYTELGRENMKNVYTSTKENKRVFLTFDDGPSSNITPLILDLLKENNIKATFFTLGSRVVQNPEIVKREYEEGHFVANHGYSHVYSSIYSSKESLLDEYNKTEEAIKNAIGVQEYSSHLFRFPGGSTGGKYDKVKREYKKVLGEQEIFYVDWNCLNEDSSGNRTKEQLVEFIKKYSANKNSVVVLMHDAGDKILTYETLQEVINYFKENGYEFYNFYDVIEYELK